MNKKTLEWIRKLKNTENSLTQTDDIITLFSEITDNSDNLSDEEKRNLVCLLWEISDETDIVSAIQIKMFLLDFTKSSELICKLYSYILENASSISANTIFYLHFQLSARIFRYNELNLHEAKYLSWKLLEQSVNRFAASFGKDYFSIIPPYARTKNLVFVITNQFLGMTHGPTKTALDRCEALIRNLKKRVVLINTAECLSLNGAIPLSYMYTAYYYDEFTDYSSIEYNGLKIPFFQCENCMPNVDTIKMILDMIVTMKPEYIVNIGGNDITGNLATKFVPSLSIGLCPSETVTTVSTCQTITRPIEEDDYELLHRMGMPKWHFLPSTFTWSLKNQEEKHSREEFGIDENAFVAGIVGARLDIELTDEFFDLLQRAGEQFDVFYMIMGEFNRISHIEKNYPLLMKRLFYVGFVKDILSYLELSDIYINPTRRGGGTAAIEAMFKGCPVLTTAFGDTSTGVGEEFWTESYDTMYELIGKYASDKSFYAYMSKKAKLRAAVMLDSSYHFSETISRFETLIAENDL